MTIEELKKSCFTSTGKTKRISNILKNNNIINSLNIYFPNSTSIYESIYRLKHDIFDIPNCPICGNKLIFLKSKNRYQNHCSSSCATKDPNVQEKLKNTKLERYNDPHFTNVEKYKKTCLHKYGKAFFIGSEEFIKKSQLTKLHKYGHINYVDKEKCRKTCLEKYGNFGKNSKKIQETCLNRYGVKSFLSSEFINSIRNNKEIQNKIQETKRKNGTFNKSEIENDIYNHIKSKYPDVIRQYKDERYPFNCDFYIPLLDLFIEYQGTWTHGKHPFDPNSNEDIELLNKWKLKNTKFYNNAITTWTIRDVNKRKTAKKNNLNWIEFFDASKLIDFIINL